MNQSSDRNPATTDLVNHFYKIPFVSRRNILLEDIHIIQNK